MISELAHRSYDLSSALGHIGTLRSVTFLSAGEEGITMVEVQEAVCFVRGVFPDVEEILDGSWKRSGKWCIIDIPPREKICSVKSLVRK